MTVRHFRSLLDVNSQELLQIISRASELKKMLAEGATHEFLKNKSLAMIFEKSSTRTRVSFEA
ncbi:ornithine carbamoyltransferase, partial [Gammaproteobacteria bacterium]|nr:ornithine carbamoyltransferase [Gammaproteobacteria bacterium]